MDLWVIIVIVITIIVIVIIVSILCLCGCCGFGESKPKVKTKPKPKTPENYFLSPDLWKSPSLEALKTNKMKEKLTEEKSIKTKRSPISPQKAIDSTNTSEDNNKT